LRPGICVGYDSGSVRNFRAVVALMLLGAATACGGKSSASRQVEQAGEPSELADAVIFLADDNVDVDFFGLRLGEARTFPFGKASGAYRWAPDRRRMFVEESPNVAAIFTVDGTRHPLTVTYPYSFSWSPDGQRSAMALDGEVAIAGADGEDVMTFPLDSTDPSTFTAWSPDGSTVTFATETSVAIVRVGSASAQIIPVAERTYVYWAPDSASFALLAPSSLQIVDVLGELLLSAAGIGELPYSWSRDGEHFAFGDCGGSIAVATPSPSEFVRLYTTSCRGAWSPSEARFAYSAQGGIQVWSGDDGTITTVAPVAGEWSWTWSPDGTMFSSFDLESKETLLIDSRDGTELGRVPGNISWNPAGTRIIASTASDPILGTVRLLSASGTGEGIRELADDTSAFIWLPDGEHLAFTTAKDVFTIHANGSERTRVATFSTPNSFGWVAPQELCPGCWPP